LALLPLPRLTDVKVRINYPLTNETETIASSGVSRAWLSILATFSYSEALVAGRVYINEEQINRKFDERIASALKELKLIWGRVRNWNYHRDRPRNCSIIRRVP
jgi:hypothetical protein